MAIATLNIPTPNGAMPFIFDAGHSTIFVGANGAGKTRLGVNTENKIPDSKVRRVAAHRSLVLSDQLSSMSFDRALRALETGHPDEGGIKSAHRYQQKPEVILLSDYDYLLQALFAQQNRDAVEHLERHTSNRNQEPPVTVLSKLKSIWERLLPHRKLRLLEMSIEVIPVNSPEDSNYPGSQMSDGERVIFYLIGHCLIAPSSAVIIIDEPELHIHKAILGKLWDLIEAARKDCSFVYITHDLDFLVSRPTAAKFVVRSYSPTKNWEIEAVPSDIELPDRLISELVGSRQPVLFVEGQRESIDATIYRSIYADFLVQPVGSCDAVIHAVATFSRNTQLHRVGNVSGCVDADAREQEEIESLQSRHIFVLPVAEIENALLLPNIFKHIAKALHFSEAEVISHQENLKNTILQQAQNELEAAAVRYAVRRLDAQLKKLAPSAKTTAELAARFSTSIANVDIEGMANSYKTKLSAYVEGKSLEGILSIYDNKGLLSIAAQQLGVKGRGDLVEFAGRLLAGDAGAPLLVALKEALPNINA